MDKNTVPELITKSARSLGAKKMWERRRMKKKAVEEKEMNWFKKHADSVAIISVVAAASWLISEKINSSRQETFTEIAREISLVRNDISRLNEEIIKIETALILKGVAPAELFAKEK